MKVEPEEIQLGEMPTSRSRTEDSADAARGDPASNDIIIIIMIMRIEGGRLASAASSFRSVRTSIAISLIDLKLARVRTIVMIRECFNKTKKDP